MSVSESEFYETGMSLPPDVRKHGALRLLESVAPEEAFDVASESWLHTEAAAAYDALKADSARAIPADDVRARFEAKWAWQAAPSRQGLLTRARKVPARTVSGRRH